MMEDLMPPGGGDGGVADHGVATSMQVVVKAANQKYNDQTIQCQGSWTVKKLKAHLAEVYPCKPKENLQKLIFSGRLLHDHYVLKDVLRSFDPDCPTTVHLVCAPGAESESSPPPEANVPASSIETTTTTSPPASTGLRRRTNPTPTPSNTANSVNSSASASASLSNQVPSLDAQSLPTSQYPQNWNAETYNAWMQQYYSHAQQPQRSMGQGGGQDYQNMYYQYWQYYMYMQYAQQMHAAAGSDAFRYAQTTGLTAVAVAPAENAPAAPEAVGNANNGAAANAAEAPPVVGAAGGAGAMFEDEEEEGRNRDWLDWLYVGSRLAVLLSIIYFYSTVGRFMLVFGFCFLVYIVRNHLYANRNGNRNRRNNNAAAAVVAAAAEGNAAVAAAVGAAAAAVVAAPVEEPAAPAEAVADADAAAVDAAAPGDGGGQDGENEPADAQQPPPDQERPSPWNIMVTIVTTFFSSLVPQPPPAN